LTNSSWDTDLVSATFIENNTTAFASATIADQGQAGTSSVIVQITGANTVGNQIADTVEFAPPALRIATQGGTIGVTYEVYEFLSIAQARTSPLFTRTGTLVRSAPVVAFRRSGNATDILAAATSTASALSGYRAIVNGAGQSGAITSSQARIMDAEFVALAAPASCAGGVFMNNMATNATLATLVAANAGGSAGNRLVVTGDFSAAAANTAVNTLANLGAAVSANSATFTTTSATLDLPTGVVAGGFTNGSVSYDLNGTTALPTATYLATLTPRAIGTTVTLSALGPISVGSIVRDGVQLESPWVTATPGFISRFFVTQTTPGAVPYTVTVRNAAGLVTGGTLSGTIAAGQVVRFDLSTLLPADTTAVPGPYQVTYNIAAPAAAVQGTYVLTSPNGSVSNMPLYRASAR
jgi:hypothetical protein